MKKIVTICLLTATVTAVLLAFYLFGQQTANVGRFTVVYFKNKCGLELQSVPEDLEALKRLPCLIRITWQEKIAPDTYQEYCYLPGKEVEKTRLIHKKD
jgi:hypothetical protein